MARHTGLAVMLVGAVLVLFPALAIRAKADPDELEITVESHMLAGTMGLFCRASPDAAAYDVDITLDYNSFAVTTSLAPTTPQVLCKWAYRGNYMKGAVLYDETWPEAAACRRGNGGCTVAFENEVMSIVSRSGASRVLGDVAVKHCRSSWLIFNTDCVYPPHNHSYVGQILGSWLEFFTA